MKFVAQIKGIVAVGILVGVCIVVQAHMSPAQAQSGAECNAQMEASGIGPRLDQLNATAGDNTNLRLRGIITTLDQMIEMSRPCAGDPAVQQAIDGWTETRNSSLTTCRQISSTDNCLESPF